MRRPDGAEQRIASPEQGWRGTESGVEAPQATNLSPVRGPATPFKNPEGPEQHTTLPARSEKNHPRTHPLRAQLKRTRRSGLFTHPLRPAPHTLRSYPGRRVKFAMKGAVQGAVRLASCWEVTRAF